MKKRSKFGTLFKMLGLVKPLSGFMCLAVLTGTLGYLAVQFIPILGGFAVLHGLKFDTPISITVIWVCLVLFALLRAVLRYTEQRTNHYSLNEAVILKSLRDETQGKTVVLVSHRESTMKIADETYSVENGRVS